MLGSVGRDAQQHIGSEHIEQENKVEYAGNVEHREYVVITYYSKKIKLC